MRRITSFFLRYRTEILWGFLIFLYCCNNVWFLDPNDKNSTPNLKIRLERLAEFKKLLDSEKKRRKLLKETKSKP